MLSKMNIQDELKKLGLYAKNGTRSTKLAIRRLDNNDLVTEIEGHDLAVQQSTQSMWNLIKSKLNGKTF